MSDPDRSPLLDGEMDEVIVHPLAAGEVALFSCRSPGREDRTRTAPRCCRSATARTCSRSRTVSAAGAPRAASALAIDALAAALLEARREQWPLRTAVMNGIERANEAIRAARHRRLHDALGGRDRGRSRSAPTTWRLDVLLLGQRGRLKLQTVAHSPVGFAVESGLLDEAEAMHHAERHLVSNVLGVPDMRIEVGSQLRLAPRDTLLLASDGLSDNLRMDEIVALLRTGPLEVACERLADSPVRACTRRVMASPRSPTT